MDRPYHVPINPAVYDHAQQTKRAQEDTALVSAEFILSISSMLFAIDCLGEALVKVGHALRELVERERTNAYKL